MRLEAVDYSKESGHPGWISLAMNLGENYWELFSFGMSSGDENKQAHQQRNIVIDTPANSYNFFKYCA